MTTLFKPGEAVVTVSQAYLEELQADSRFLQALKAAGVDNWGGYSDAWDILREMEGEDE